MSPEQVAKSGIDEHAETAGTRDGSPIHRLIKNLEVKEAEVMPSHAEGNGAEAPSSPDYSLRRSGFAAVREDLDRTSREAGAMIQILEQSRQQLASAETQRDTSYRTLHEVLPLVESTARELKAAIDACKDGRTPENMDALFNKNGNALTQLETAATALKAQFVVCRSACRQFHDSMEKAKQLRASSYSGQ